MTLNTPVRYNSDAEEFELRCLRCLEWLPLDVEFWIPAQGLRTCKTCRQEAKNASVDRLRYKRSGVSMRLSDRMRRANSKKYYDLNRDRLRRESLKRYHARKAELQVQP